MSFILVILEIFVSVFSLAVVAAATTKQQLKNKHTL